MTWVKLEDTIPDHDKVVRAGDRASWLWVSGLCWSSRHLADGKLPYDVVGRLTDQKDAYALADRLVEVGLWRRTKTGFSVFNYSKFQRTRAQVEEEREKGRERQQRARASRPRHAVTNGDVTEPEKRQRRSRKTPQTPLAGGPSGPAYKETIRCPRCMQLIGDGWSDCECPPLEAVPDLREAQ